MAQELLRCSADQAQHPRQVAEKYLLADIQIPPWILGLGGILGTVGVLGAAFAVLKSNVATRTIELWKEQAGAWEERVRQVEGENTRLKVESEANKARLETLEASNKLLSNQVAAAPEMIALRRDIGTQHNEILGMLEQVMAAEGVKPKRRRRAAPPEQG